MGGIDRYFEERYSRILDDEFVCPDFTSEDRNAFIQDFANADDAEKFWEEFVNYDYTACAKVMQQVAKEYLKNIPSLMLWEWAKEPAYSRFLNEQKEAWLNRD